MLLLNMCKFIANAARTTVNVKNWKLGKEILEGNDADKKREAAAKMREVGLAEIENARNTIPLVEYDSRLGYEPSMEYMCDREHIEWKLALTERAVNEELEQYL